MINDIELSYLAGQCFPGSEQCMSLSFAKYKAENTRGGGGRGGRGGGFGGDRGGRGGFDRGGRGGLFFMHFLWMLCLIGGLL